MVSRPAGTTANDSCLQLSVDHVEYSSRYEGGSVGLGKYRSGEGGACMNICMRSGTFVTQVHLPSSAKLL